ncbi:MAG: C4-dicarboxylate transporter DcuC [Deferribacteraceae bacterium]|nr:C4-dicarboxylate transporter DcuC [Deferribacteraceae bacterium]
MVMIISLIVLVLAGYAIAKNYDAKLVLFAAGFFLLFCAVILKFVNGDIGDGGAGNLWVSPLLSIKTSFLNQYAGPGLIIMTLFGFSSYMSHIGANNTAINIMTKPISFIRSPHILVPIVFWLGTMLSLVVPSASSLAVILMATLYPILRATGMSSLTAGAVIATTATVAPTPLGGDNIVAAKLLIGPSVTDLNTYVYAHHATISLWVIVAMGFVHLFWQWYMDKREGQAAFVDVDESKLEKLENLPPAYYGLFPILPLILVLVQWKFFPDVKIGIVEITLFCFALAFLAEVVRKRNIKQLMKDANLFFSGMGQGFSQVVVLIVAAGTTIMGLNAIGAIDIIANVAKDSPNAGTGLMFIFSGITAVITFISGSGNAAFYSFIELIPPIASQAGVDPIMVSLPMQLTSNLIRAVSPVSAVVIIVASVMKVSPLRIVKRTAVPLLFGFVMTMVMAFLKYNS